MMLSDSHLSSVGELESRRMSLALMVMPATCCCVMGVSFGSWYGPVRMFRILSLTLFGILNRVLAVSVAS